MKSLWLIGTARNAIVMIAATVIAGACANYGYDIFTPTGNITQGIPPFRPPTFYIQGNVTVGNTTEYINWGPKEIFSVSFVHDCHTVPELSVTNRFIISCRKSVLV